MKQQTRPPKPEKTARFIYEKSQWINVKSEEKGNKNHFVEAQARKVCELLGIAFSTAEVEYEEDAVDYSIDTSGLLQGLNEEFLTTELTTSQLGKFGFGSVMALEKLSARVRDNLLLGMKLYFLLEPVYRVNPRFDASCCAILFCKAMELRMKAAGKPQYDENWWKAFEARLQDCTSRRNQCCHSGLFIWMDHLHLLADLFRADKTKGRDPKIGGIMFESAAGMVLSRCLKR